MVMKRREVVLADATEVLLPGAAGEAPRSSRTHVGAFSGTQALLHARPSASRNRSVVGGASSAAAGGRVVVLQLSRNRAHRNNMG